MNQDSIFLPVLIQITLVIALYVYLAIAKSRASQRGEVDEDRRALFDNAWPDSVLKINNCIRNQFEVPVLFYVLITILWSLSAVNIFVHVVSWLFVATRIVHAYIHTGSNYVPLRRCVFSIGILILLVLTIFAVVALFSD
jgi:hypothetical protein